MLSVRAAALTDIGRVRRDNEDRYLKDEKTLLFGVADGVGGLPGGAEAANLTAEELSRALRAVPAGRDPDWVKIVQQTNELVAALGRRISPAMGIGTTLTLGCIRNDDIVLAHVGDSRGYVLHDGEFIRLTEDHSVENEARLRRARGEVIYYHEANRNALTRCIGQPTPPEVDIITRPLAVGERYIFCTDGITRMMPDDELGELLGKFPDPADALREIVGLAVRRGGPDNATAVAVYIDSL